MSSKEKYDVTYTTIGTVGDSKPAMSGSDLEKYAQEVGKTIESSLQQARATSNLYTAPNLYDSISDRYDKVLELAEKSKPMAVTIGDRYGNSLASVGTDDKVQGFSTYGFSADTLQWPLWLALYNDSWVFKRAIDKPATDMIASGFRIKGNNVDKYNEVYEVYDSHKTELEDLIRWGALFGGSIGVMLFDDIAKKDLEKPLKKSAIKGKTFKIYVTDRWYGLSPTVDKIVSNMKDIDFGKPKFYEVTFADGKMWKVHHSWVLRYEHRTAPNLIKNGYLQGWGYAEGSHLINELARDDQLKTSITSLVNKALIEVIKMSGMRGVFMGTDKGNEVQLRKRLEMVNWGRTYNSLTFLDKDDEYQQYQLTGLSGLAELLEKNMYLVAAAEEMPGILFGDLKGGLSQESDAFSRWAQVVYNKCDSLYRPVLKKFLTIVFIVCDIKTKSGKIEKPKFTFEYLDKAERNKKKVEAIGNVSNTLSKLEQDGIISKYMYAIAIRDYTNQDTLNLTFPDEILHKLQLEQEQAILDTLKDLSKKRKKNINYNAEGKIDMSSPFTEEEIEEGEDNSPDIDENEPVDENVESAETTTEISTGESTNEGQEQ